MDKAEEARPEQEDNKQLAAPKRLDAYIKVTNASVWLILAALIILMAAFLYWGFEGNLVTTINTFGYVREDGLVNCYVECDNTKETLTAVQVGMKAELSNGTDSAAGSISFVDDIPLSREELLPTLKYDYFAANIEDFEWYTLLIITPDTVVLPADSTCKVKITIEEKRPIEFLLQSGK